MQKKRTWILIGIILIIVAIVSYLTFRSDALRFKNDYEWYNLLIVKNKNKKVSLPSKNKVTYLSAKEFISKMKTETGFFYLGYPTCPWCRNIVSPLVEVSNQTNQPIYYLDIHHKDVNESFKEEFMSLYGEYLREDTEGKKKIYVPDVYFVKKGKVLGHHIGSIDSQKDSTKDLTETERKELMEIYREMMNEKGEKNE